MRNTLVCVGTKGELVKTLTTTEAPPATLAVGGVAFQRIYEENLVTRVVAVYGVIPKGATKTETAK